MSRFKMTCRRRVTSWISLLICYYFSRPSRPRVSRDVPCSSSTAGERLLAPHGSTDKGRSSFPGRLPGPIDDWRDVASSTRYIRTRIPQEFLEKGKHAYVVRRFGLGRYPSALCHVARYSRNGPTLENYVGCLLYTSDAADE